MILGGVNLVEGTLLDGNVDRIRLYVFHCVVREHMSWTFFNREATQTLQFSAKFP